MLTGTLREFRDFVMRGNILDLAIAVVIGAAFGDVIKAAVTYIITPIITIPGKVSFGDFYWELGGARFGIGPFLNALISFILIAAAIFFLIVKPMSAIMNRVAKPDAVVTRECPYCLSSIPLKASRCSYCTSEVPVVA